MQEERDMMAAIRSRLRGEMLYDEPLRKYTTWRVGGPAKHLYRPADGQDLAHFLGQLPEDEPLLWLGMGSNLLVRDGGFDGTVISTRGCLNGIELVEPGLLWAEAGVGCPKAARRAAKEGLCGLEFLNGIPGAIGGALAMNAGAFGSEIWRWVERVETVDRSGEIRVREPSDYGIGYRQLKGPAGEWFLAAWLRLEPGDVAASQKEMKQLLEKRAEAQPIGLPSCGSVFENPPGDYAARLIELAGLKGTSIGGACVSEKHANFIINTGDATATDIESLIELVQQRVESHCGIRLQTEVRIVGEAVKP